MRRLIGIHAVAAALKSSDQRRSGIERVLVAKGSRNPRVLRLVEQCRDLGVPVRFEPRAAIRRSSGTAAHQGIVALTSAAGYSTLRDLLEELPEVGTLVVLDQVQDPRNLGAIIRSAEAAGARGVVVPERRSASLGAAAAKAAGGALESQPVARVKNLGRGLDELKRCGFWVYGLDAGGNVIYDQVDYRARCALVLGGESRGLRAKVAQRCDFLIRIPLAGSVPSLNVSVAAGIALFEVSRQRRLISAEAQKL